LADQLFKLGLFVGTGVNSEGMPTYDLPRPLTRLEGLALMIRLMGLEKEAAQYKGVSIFTDVPAWGERLAAYAYSVGLTQSVNELHTEFAPGRLLTYREFTAFLLRVLGYYENQGDFQFEQALNKALEIQLYTAQEKQTLGNGIDTNAFLRGEAVISMINAMMIPVKGSDGRLMDQLVRQGVATEQQRKNFIDMAGALYYNKRAA
jgi:hypothetical protein